MRTVFLGTSDACQKNGVANERLIVAQRYSALARERAAANTTAAPAMMPSGPQTSSCTTGALWLTMLRATVVVA